MPLETGKSRAAFENNLKTEIAAGNPKEQALAIAYSKQRGDALTPSATLANNIQEFLLALEHCGDRADRLKLRFDSMMAEDCK